MNLILLRAKVLPLIVPPKERKRYITAINRRNTRGQLLGYYNYMLGLLNKFQEMYQKMFIEEDSTNLITVSKFAKVCGVPISTIRYYI